MTVLSTLGIILLLAFLVETLAEFLFGTVAGFFPNGGEWFGKYRLPVIQVISIAAGVGGSWIYQFDVIYLLGQFLNSPVDLEIFGVVITGIAVGKGSNYIHQLISQFFPSKQ